MNSLVYKWLYIIIHNLVNVFEEIFHIGFEIYEKIEKFVNYKLHPWFDKLKNKHNDRCFIYNNSECLKSKLPKHLAVILQLNDKKDVDLEKLSQIVEWSLVSGVNYLTFYDIRGILKNQLCQSLEKRILQLDEKFVQNDEKIVWGMNTRKQHRNGFRKYLIVNLLSLDDGIGNFNRLLNEELVKVKSANINCDVIDEKLRELNENILPDPDLAVYFGNICCTQGLLPWHIRLTEFYKLSQDLNSISPQKFMQVLQQFGRCEQRFGK